ncbi:hypothetical protein [Roseateles asaccharophilus]|uniref:Uncharacterized protein n=1 Tax=Roseateles asaccharophilus TaxID=582607 RepID=A0ABU2A3H6_9BURK|nr:hypothetical protein [Roseateles asaccharophilus]MDR7331742.1 hypothetical protein [Roseateles asaccharophilus]
MTKDNDAVNKFLERLQMPSAEATTEEATVPQQRIVINRPVRCTFVIGSAQAEARKPRARRQQ